jgi:nucleoside-diphosphate-sugar epimerase
VLLTGSTGFVGGHTSAALVASGLTVRQASRRAVAASPTAERGMERVVVGEVGPETDWAEALRGVDVVVHLAARVHVMDETEADPLGEFRRVNVEGTRRLARQAADAGVRRFVFVSSVKVNGEETTGEQFREDDAPAPADPYGVSKWEAERALRDIEAATGLEVVVVRPPLVYGPGVRANFLRLLEGVSRGVPFPFARVENRRSLVFVRNLADALARCATHPAAAGRTFLVSDGTPVSSADLVRGIARAMGRRPRLVPVPPSWLELAARLAGRAEVVRRLLGSLEVDDRAIRDALGWKPPFAMEEGLVETVAWWRENPGS